MPDEDFMDRIHGPFIGLTATIFCHSLGCWRTAIGIDNVAFTRATSRGKKNNLYGRFRKCPDPPKAWVSR